MDNGNQGDLYWCFYYFVESAFTAGRVHLIHTSMEHGVVCRWRTFNINVLTKYGGSIVGAVPP